jgi:hypothetical protein
MVQKKKVPIDRARRRLRFSTGYFITERCRWRSGVNGRLLVVGLGEAINDVPLHLGGRMSFTPSPRQIPETGIFEGQNPGGFTCPVGPAPSSRWRASQPA